MKYKCLFPGFFLPYPELPEKMHLLFVKKSIQCEWVRMEKERKDAIRMAYDLIAPKFAETCFYELHDKPVDKKLYDLFYERVINRGKSLEIGCGPGEISNYLWLKGLDITGIDISEKMIETAKGLNPRIEFRTGDVFDLHFQDNSIAGIVAPYLIVNFLVQDIPAAIKEMNRVLMHAGVLLLSFHTGDGSSEIKNDFFMKGNSINYTFFKPEDIKSIVTENNFEIIEYMIRSPCDGEVTTRAYIFARKV